MDVGEVMTRKEIYDRFDSEWVLVGDPETEENLMLIRGTVLWHGKDREELYRWMANVDVPYSTAILYTGTISEEAALTYQLWKYQTLYGAPTRS